MRRGLGFVVVLAAAAIALSATAGATTGASAPPVAGKTLAGKRLALGDLRGKPVVINVWSSW